MHETHAHQRFLSFLHISIYINAFYLLLFYLFIFFFEETAHSAHDLTQITCKHFTVYFLIAAFSFLSCFVYKDR